MPESTEHAPEQTANMVPEYTQTLNDLLSSAAAEWSPNDRLALIKALRNQRERWNAEQAVGSKKRVTSKQVGVGKKKVSKKGLSLSGLKL